MFYFGIQFLSKTHIITSTSWLIANATSPTVSMPPVVKTTVPPTLLHIFVYHILTVNTGTLVQDRSLVIGVIRMWTLEHFFSKACSTFAGISTF